MAVIYEPVSGRALADPDRPLPPETAALQQDVLERALSRYILSVSGWRAVFAAAEESDAPAIRDADAVLLAVAGRTIAELMRERSTRFPPCIALAIDSRPTGPAIGDLLLRTLLAYDVEVQYLYVAAAPEIMAYTKMCADLEGFVYVTASHNPIGHNGLKLGLSDGAVLERERALDVIERFRTNVGDPEYVRSTVRTTRSLPAAQITQAHLSYARWKQRALQTYAAFVRRVISGSGDRQQQIIAALADAVRSAGAGVLVDFNGSARAASVDRTFLREMGFRFTSMHDSIGRIAHAIIPEGAALEPCMNVLEKLQARDEGYRLGYVPDNDGDRGNLVVYLPRSRRVAQLPAQQGFALAVLAELAWRRLQFSDNGIAEEPLAVAANDATSLRIEEIAAAFGARVFRAEVGEANVVNLAQLVRTQGYVVPILGEGSNGGTIVHPSTVRDPLTAIGSLAKLLYARSASSGKDLFAVWCAAAALRDSYRSDYCIEDVIETLPRFQTTATTDPDAVMKISTDDHVLLKLRYEQEFRRQWQQRRAELETRFGIVAAEEINYEGTDERHGFGPDFRSGAQRGGLKMLFRNRDQQAIGFVWMRGSGTEPVFRVLADIRSSDPADAAYLLSWHRSMVEAADRGA
ncbi:MAG: phosphatidylglycerol lysyltransferase [Spirochaetaceae bacterium]|nr:MAG: phosphatidylglycerol lysyltransferase [Spirochaetaceae bacterium]